MSKPIFRNDARARMLAENWAAGQPSEGQTDSERAEHRERLIVDHMAQHAPRAVTVTRMDEQPDVLPGETPMQASVRRVVDRHLAERETTSGKSAPVRAAREQMLRDHAEQGR